MSEDIKVKFAPIGHETVVAALRRVIKESAEAGNVGAKGVNALIAGYTRLGALIPTVGFIGAVAGITAMTKASLNYFDAIGKAAERTGTTAENFSVLAFAAATADASTEDLEKSMVRLAKNVGDMQRGTGEAAESFRELGFTTASFKGKDTAEIFALVAARIGKLPDGVDKTRVALEILGKGGAKLIPLMNDIATKGFAAVAAEAAAFGAIVGTDAADAAKGLNDNITLLDIAAKKLSRTVAGNLAPDLREFTNAIVEAAKESGLLTAAWVALGGVAKLGWNLTFGRTNIEEAREEVQQIEGIIASTRKLIERGRTKVPFLPFDIEFNDEALATLRKNLTKQEAALVEAKGRLDKIINPLGKTKKGGADAGLEGDFDVSKKIAEIGKRIGIEETRALQETSRNRLQVLTETQKVEQAALEARLAGQKDNANAQAQLDAAEVERLKARGAAVRDAYETEVNLARARQAALTEAAKREFTDPKTGAEATRTIAKLKEQIDGASLAERLKAARGYFDSLTTLAAQYFTAYKQQALKIVEFDKEIAANKKQLAGILEGPKPLDQQDTGALRTRGLELETEAARAALKGDVERARAVRAEILQLVEQLQARGETVLARQFGEEANRQFEIAVNQQKALAQATADAAKAGAEAAKKEAEQIKARVETLTTMEIGAIQLKLALNTQSYRDLIAELRQSLGAEVFTIAVRPVVGQPSGMAAGGEVRRLASGGAVPGISPTPYADDKLIWGTSGEFMQPVRAVQHYGVDFMEAVRKMELPRFAEGGMVGGDHGTAAGMGAVQVHDIRVNGRQAARVLTSREEIRKLVDAINEVSLGT